MSFVYVFYDMLLCHSTIPDQSKCIGSHVLSDFLEELCHLC